MVRSQRTQSVLAVLFIDAALNAVQAGSSYDRGDHHHVVRWTACSKDRAFDEGRRKRGFG
jgi:hypothetical protein